MDNEKFERDDRENVIQNKKENIDGMSKVL